MSESAEKLTLTDGAEQSSSVILDYCRKREISIPELLANNGNQKKVKVPIDNTENQEEAVGSLNISRLFDSSDVESTETKDRTEDRKNYCTSPKESKTKPNYFLAIRIQNKDIHTKVTGIHESIQIINADFKHTFIHTPTLHLTLNVMSLDSEKGIEKAIDALKMSLAEIMQAVKDYPNKELELSGLGDFKDQVVFVDIKENEALNFVRKLVNILKTAFEELNIDYEKKETFTPHVTIMKLSKCFKLMRKKGIKIIPKKLYEKSKDLYFGTDEVKEILLCSMTDKKEKDGFYKVLADIDLEKGKLNIGSKLG